MTQIPDSCLMGRSKQGIVHKTSAMEVVICKVLQWKTFNSLEEFLAFLSFPQSAVKGALKRLIRERRVEKQEWMRDL